jgi:hypothetical protein
MSESDEYMNQDEFIIRNKEARQFNENFLNSSYTKVQIINTKLISVINMPKNVKSLTIMENDIQELDGSFLPDTLEELIFKNNNTIQITNLKEGIKILDLSSNNILIIDKIPNSVVNLNISNNRNITDFTKWDNNNITHLDISNTKIRGIIDKLNDNITHLTANKCHIMCVNHLPLNLIYLSLNESRINFIKCDFPHNLEYLSLHDNSLFTIPNLPFTIKSVILSDNMLTEIPFLPSSVTFFDIRKNVGLTSESIELLNEMKKNFDNINILFTPPEEEQSYSNIIHHIRPHYAGISEDIRMSSTHRRHMGDDVHVSEINRHQNTSHDDTDMDVMNWNERRERRMRHMRRTVVKEENELSFVKSNPNYIIFKKEYAL